MCSIHNWVGNTVLSKRLHIVKNKVKESLLDCLLYAKICCPRGWGRWKWKWSRSVLYDSLRPHGLVAYQAPPSMGLSRQACWSGLPFPSPRGWGGSHLFSHLWGWPSLACLLEVVGSPLHLSPSMAPIELPWSQSWTTCWVQSFTLYLLTVPGFINWAFAKPGQLL